MVSFKGKNQTKHIQKERRWAMGKHHWHEIFVAESIVVVIATLRINGVVVDYNENVDPPGLAMGYLENNGGIILSCDIWRVKKAKEIIVRKQEIVKTSIELQGSNGDFLKLAEIIGKTLTVIEEDCSFCNPQKALE